LTWCEKWLDIISAKLRFGGSFYVFGYFRNLAPFLTLAESRGLELRQQIIIDKGIKSVAGRKTSTYRLFPNVTESILFFTKDNKQIIKPLLKNRADELGLKSKEINERLGVKSNGGGMWSIYTGKNMCEQFPTKATWDKLMKVLEMELDYYKYAQTFNPIMGITDVWTDIDFYSRDRIHPTEKPYKLIERLILSSSNEGDNILDPFSGSGITGIVSSSLKRKCILFEIDEQYYKASINRFTDMGITYESIQ
jgi:site-specific DNA-methyltransferase (adenine-specific)